MRGRHSLGHGFELLEEISTSKYMTTRMISGRKWIPTLAHGHMGELLDSYSEEAHGRLLPGLEAQELLSRTLI